MAKNIPFLDLSFLLVETPESPTHVACLLLFDLPERPGGRFVSNLASEYRKSPTVAPFDQIAEFSLRRMPRWVKADKIDMKYHVQHCVLPPGSSREDLYAFVSDLHSQVLDRHQPGFRVYLIEGAPGGGFAMFLKIHHSLVDGQSAVARIIASLSAKPGSRAAKPFFAVRVGPKSGPASPPPRKALGAAVFKQALAAKDLYLSLIRKRLSGAGALTGSVPFTAPRAAMNAPSRSARSLATLSLPLEEMRTVGRAFGGTINDVAVAIVDAGLVRYLSERGERVDKPLVAMCPVSLREANDTEATTKASAMFVPLGKPKAGIAARMEQVVANSRSAKDELRAMSKDAAMLYGITALTLAVTGEKLGNESIIKPLANFVVSNVPGSSHALHLRGARMQAIYPVSTLGMGVGLNATLLSYNGSMDFGFVGNGASLPDLEPLAAHVGQAFAELKRAAAKRR